MIIKWLQDYARLSINSLLIDERRCIPPHIILEFGNQGLFGMQISKSYGGLALSYAEIMSIMQQLGAIDLTLATLLATHTFSLYLIQKYGSATLKKTFLPLCAQGREICAFGLTEVGSGSNPYAITTTAVPMAGQQWRLTGKKMWVDSGSWSSVITTFAKVQDKKTNSQLMTAFAVPLKIPGVSMEEEVLTMGLRGMIQNHVSFHNAVVNKDNLLGEIGEGMMIVHDVLAVARLMLAAKSIGVMKHCLQFMHRYSLRRTIATGLLVDNPVILSWLCEFTAVITAIETLMQFLVKRLDAGQRDPAEIFMAIKIFATEYLWKTADLTMQALGARGYMENNVIARILRDVRTMRISEGPTETLHMALGSTIINTGKSVYDFVADVFGNRELAESLLKTSAIKNRCVADQKMFSNTQTAINWTYYLVGQITTYTILLAAVDQQLRKEKNEPLQLAHRWLTQQLADFTRAGFEGNALESALTNGTIINNIINDYSQTLGNLEQNAAGVEYRLDPLLRTDVTADLSQDIDRNLTYWQKHLAAPLGALYLSTDYPRKTQELIFATCEIALDPQLIRKIKKIIHPEQITLETLLLTAFYILLGQYSEHEDILLACYEGKRDALFPLKLSFPQDISAHEALHRLYDTLSVSEQHGKYDFLHLVSLLEESANLNLIEKITILFAMDVVPKIMALDNLELTFLFIKKQFSCQFIYAKQLFQPETIARMAQHFINVLEAIIEHIHTPINEFNLLSKPEQDLLIKQFNQTAVSYPQGSCLHQFFEQQAVKSGKKIAAYYKESSITYAELNRKANQLAHLLQNKGVRPGELVGILLDHSFELLIGLLGILKVGAAYVPIDPAYPSQRIQFVMHDAKLRWIVTRSDLIQNLPEHAAAVLCLDTVNYQDMLGSPVQCSVNPLDIAYVIYTSGSTGIPKGVRVAHTSVVNFLNAMCQQPGFSNRDVMLAHTTITFDIAGLELYLPLVVGGCVVLTPREIVKNGKQLIKYIGHHKVTTMQATPALWQMLIASDWQGDPKLKILCGGEALSADLAEKLLMCCAELWNMYGPTEATIWCSLYRLPRQKKGIIAIGKPIANMQFYVLDRNKKLAPLGIPGELCLAGIGLAQGYLNRPEIESERFIWHTLHGKKIKLYRTGDLVKYLPDGNVIFLGRVDRQIKLRGFRIEPGEIEYALRKHPNVSEAVVVIKKHTNQDLRLVAYILPRNVAVEAEVLCGFLQGQLPSYMVPNLFVTLTELPLTTNGKIDYRGLPEIDWNKFETGLTLVAPQNAVQSKIAEIWREAFAVSEIGINSNFFTLGGHSLLAVQIISRIMHEFPVELSLSDFFTKPTIMELAAFVESNKKTRMSPIKKQQKKNNIPLTYGEQWIWDLLMDVPQAAKSIYNTSVAFEIIGSLNVQQLKKALQQLLIRHEILSTVFQLKGNKVTKQIGKITHLPLKIDSLMRLDAKDQKKAILKIVQAEEKQFIDLGKGPLVRFRLVQLRQNKYILQITGHHIIVDGTSREILCRDLSFLYNNKENQLPSLPVQYADFGVWQQSWFNTHKLPEQIHFWKQYLAHLPEKMTLRDAKPYPKKPDYKGAKVAFKVSAKAFANLQNLSKAYRASLFSILFAAFYVLLYRHSKCEDMLIGYAITSRPKNTENLIGMFTNSLPLRVHIKEGEHFSHILEQVKGGLTTVFQYAETVLSQQLDIPKNPIYRPFFQVIIAPLEDFNLAFNNLEIKNFPINGPIFCKYDLMLAFKPQSDAMDLIFEYKTSLFSEEKIQSLANEFNKLLERIEVGEVP